MDGSGKKAPESEENRTYEQSCCAFPDNTAQKQRKKCTQTQISPADGEHIIKPHPAGTQKKQQIADCCMPGPQGTQKPIPQPQDCSQKESDGKAPGGDDRVRHPQNLRQPLKRGSS